MGYPVQVQVNPAVSCPLCKGKEGQTVTLWGQKILPNALILVFKCVACDFFFSRRA